MLRGCLWAALMVLILWGAPGRVHAGGPVPPIPKDTIRTGVFTIEEKAPESHHIFILERRFRVAHGAPILDYGGRSIPLKFLPTPCRAKITYSLFGDHRDPLVEKIQLW